VVAGGSDPCHSSNLNTALIRMLAFRS
jgi:hypothetical protein